MATIRQQIIDAIQPRFEGITVNNGYQTDVGRNVFLWRETPLESEELPGVVFRDKTVKKLEETFGAVIYDLPIEVVVFMAESGTTTDELRKAVADILKAIAVDVSWGAIAEDTQIPDSDSMDIDHGDKIRGGIQFEFSVLYSADRWST